MANNNTLSHPYDLAFKQGLRQASPWLTAPLINEMFHPDVPLDRNTFIQHLSNEFISLDGKKVKFTDSQLCANNDIYHIECDCYAGDEIITQIAEYDLYAGLNYAKLDLKDCKRQQVYIQ